MTATMGDRLEWARHQQGLTLDALAERAGLAVGYVHQLAHNVKVNPTLSKLEGLARSLGVTVAFLVGEVDGPLFAGSHMALGESFEQHIAATIGSEKFRLLHREERFRMATLYAISEKPRRWTKSVLAYELGLSVRELNDILGRGLELRMFVLAGFCRLSGISLQLLLAGEGGAQAPDLPAERFYQRYLQVAGRRGRAHTRRKLAGRRLIP